VPEDDRIYISWHKLAEARRRVVAAAERRANAPVPVAKPSPKPQPRSAARLKGRSTKKVER